VDLSGITAFGSRVIFVWQAFELEKDCCGKIFYLQERFGDIKELAVYFQLLSLKLYAFSVSEFDHQDSFTDK
jgi:hypothetical protein